MIEPLAGYEPLTDAEWPAGLEAVRDDFAGRLNIYRVMARHPALLRAWSALRRHLVVDSSLPPDAREVITLRVGYRWRARYEWVQHVVRGREAGLSDERINACRAELPDGPDSRLIASVDALLANGRLDGRSLARLDALLGPQGVFDLMATVGMYTTLAFMLNSLRVPIEPGMLAALAANPLAD